MIGVRIWVSRASSLGYRRTDVKDVCGFFFRDPPSYSPPPELLRFIDGGPPPIYIGFGSIVIDDPERITGLLLEAIQRTGVRALISRGWSNLGGTATDNVMYLGDCPHEWLFQHVAAVIHHGGAGTTACGLLHGRPTTIVPFFGEYVITQPPIYVAKILTYLPGGQSAILGRDGRGRRRWTEAYSPKIPHGR